MKEEIDVLQKKTLAVDFWEDNEKAQKVISEMNDKKDIYDKFQDIYKGFANIKEMLEMIDEVDFPEFQDDLTKGVERYSKGLDNLTVQTLLSGEYDKNNAVLSIHAGQGGLEATDWAQMLFRMYTRWIEKSGFKYEVTDYNSEDGAGIKSCTIEVKGKNAYGMLKSEKGVHRLVRISPFDSNSRRHTSFSSIDVFPELENNTEVEIKDEDIRVDTYRSSGAGGQHVNTTDSAIRITHLPTGLVVTCQNERSQIQNREKAMNMLKAKLIQIKEEEKKEKIEDIQGSYAQIAWGSQIRSYVFQPYTMVKDHRTNYEVGNIDRVMDGDLDGFMSAYLKYKKNEEK